MRRPLGDEEIALNKELFRTNQKNLHCNERNIGIRRFLIAGNIALTTKATITLQLKSPVKSTKINFSHNRRIWRTIYRAVNIKSKTTNFWVVGADCWVSKWLKSTRLFIVCKQFGDSQNNISECFERTQMFTKYEAGLGWRGWMQPTLRSLIRSGAQLAEGKVWWRGGRTPTVFMLSHFAHKSRCFGVLDRGVLSGAYSFDCCRPDGLEGASGSQSTFLSNGYSKAPNHSWLHVILISNFVLLFLRPNFNVFDLITCSYN